MSVSVLIIGESGTGKSTSIRNLDPKETFIINVLNKPLPFRGYKKHYTPFSNENPAGNHYSTDNYEKIEKLIEGINKNNPEIKNLIIDDFQFIISNEFISRAMEKGYDKFSQMGQHFASILYKLKECRGDLNCIVMSHCEIGEDGKSRMKTVGKMIDQYLKPEGIFTFVFHTTIREGQYKFITKNDGVHVAKSPMGLFEEKLIDNDLKIILKEINDYLNEDVFQEDKSGK